jgi:hypothetical protein
MSSIGDPVRTPEKHASGAKARASFAWYLVGVETPTYQLATPRTRSGAAHG